MGSDVVNIARQWLGTPYEHQASCLGAGADCLGLIRGVWRVLIGDEPTSMPAYTPDWGEPDKNEVLLRAMHLYLRPVENGAELGDVLLFRMRNTGPAKHLAILSDAGENKRIIHAYSGRGVVETILGSEWESRIVGVFRFPDRRN